MAPGKALWESRLWDIQGSWEAACASQPFVWVDKQTSVTTIFPEPTRCVNYGIWSGMWGQIWIDDDGCNPEWGSFKDDGCLFPKMQGYHKYSSVLWGIPAVFLR